MAVKDAVEHDHGNRGLHRLAGDVRKGDGELAVPMEVAEKVDAEPNNDGFGVSELTIGHPGFECVTPDGQIVILDAFPSRPASIVVVAVQPVVIHHMIGACLVAQSLELEDQVIL